MQKACRLNCLHNGINLIVICFKFCCKYNVDKLVFCLCERYGVNVELSKEVKRELLSIPTLDVRIGGKRSPLMVAVGQTTASLYKCFSGELRRVIYPEYNG